MWEEAERTGKARNKILSERLKKFPAMAQALTRAHGIIARGSDGKGRRDVLEEIEKLLLD